MTDVAENFEPIAVSGKILVEAEDGRTCEIDIHPISLDRKASEPWVFAVDYDPQWEDNVFARGLSRVTSNPISEMSVSIKVDAVQPDRMFTMTFRERQS